MDKLVDPNYVAAFWYARGKGFTENEARLFAATHALAKAESTYGRKLSGFDLPADEHFAIFCAANNINA